MRPIRPQHFDLVQFAPNVAVKEESFEKPEDSPLGMAKNGLVDVVGGFGNLDADAGELAVRPRALPTPKMPSPEIIAHHNLKHVPYGAWCPFCVAGCTPDSHHLSRSIDN